MDADEYVAVALYRERLAEARALAARRVLLDADPPPRRSTRGSLGLVLLGFGRWILDHARAGKPQGLELADQSVPELTRWRG